MARGTDFVSETIAAPANRWEVKIIPGSGNSTHYIYFTDPAAVEFHYRAWKISQNMIR